MTKPSREQLLEEGRKQARIHGVNLATVFAEIYAEGWVAAREHSQAELRERIRKAKEILEITEDREIPAICWQIAKEVRAALAGEDEPDEEQA